MAKYINLEELMKFPIRRNHYDKEHGNEDFICGIETVLEYAENLQTADVVQEWISVKDRLPENEQDVIICAERRHYSNPNRFIRIVAKAFYTDGKHNTEHTAYVWSNDYIDMEYDEENDAYLIPEGWWESVEYREEFSAVSDFVTHWMPLPQPPKGE